MLLNAHATTSAGQQQLNDIQKKIVDAVNNPTMEMDTPAGERAFLTFLRNQVGATNELLGRWRSRLRIKARPPGRWPRCMRSTTGRGTPMIRPSRQPIQARVPLRARHRVRLRPPGPQRRRSWASWRAGYVRSRVCRTCSAAGR